MDRRDYIDEFEDFLQQNADRHKLYPSDKIWAGINQSLHPERKWPYLFVAIIFIGLGIAGKIHDGQFNIAAKSSTSFALQMPVDDQKTAINTAPFIAESKSNHQNIPVKASTVEVNTAREINKPQLTTELAFNETVLDVTPVNQNDFNNTPTLEISDEQLLINDFVFQNKDDKKNKASLSAAETNIKPSISSKFGWQFYISPTTSYRKLSGKGLPYYTNAGSNMNSVFANGDIEKSVTHKPSIGFEMGGAITYNASTAIRLKAGLQFNVNRYEVQAFHSVPEVAPMTSNAGSASINVVSTFRNYSGFSKTWLKNQHIMMSLPVGAEIRIMGNDKISFNIAGTIQPTLVVNNQAYMISTNMRNYAKAPSLYKEFNVAAGAEAFLSVKGKSLTFNIGPQFRYQLFSSYKKPYPISEHLTDYGLKVSIGR